MKTTLKIFLCIFALLISINVNAAPKTFHYFIRVPSTNLSCDAEAKTLGARFATQAQVVESVCRGVITITADKNQYQLYSLLVTYAAEHEIYPYTAIYGTSSISNIPGDGDGIYGTYAECLSDINFQRENFAKATGTEVLGAYCNPVDDISHFTYKLQIAGIGTKQKSLYVFNPRFIGVEDEQTKADIRNTVTSLGGQISKEFSSQIFYYANTSLNLSNQLLGLFKNPAECQAQLSDAKNIFAASGATTIIAKCYANPNPYGSSTSLEVIDDGYKGISQDYGSQNQYYSFQECMADRSRVVADAGPSALGGICAPSRETSGQYSLNLYRRF